MPVNALMCLLFGHNPENFSASQEKTSEKWRADLDEQYVR